MKRALINLALTITAFIIQNSIFPLLPSLSAALSLLLTLTFLFGFMEEKRVGMAYDVVAGFLLDLFYSGPFDFYTLFYVYVGYINSICTKYHYEDYITLPLVLYLFNELVYDLYVYTFRFLIRGRLNFLYYFRELMIPKIIFIVVTTLFAYRLLLHVSRRLHEIEKRRDTDIT